jgi:hypothetical protein
MKIDFDGGIKLVKGVVEDYVTTFILILVSPYQFFLNKVNEKEDDRKNLSQTLIYVAIGLILGLVLASSINIKGDMKEIGKEQLLLIIVPYLFSWILYGLVLHLLVKIFKGMGTVWNTITGLLYILATLHPILLFLLFIISSILPLPAEYGLTVRSIVEYADYGVELAKPGDNIISGLYIGGVFLKPLYWGVSYLLTCIYLYFPLKVYHQFPIEKIFGIYIIGLLSILSLVFIGAFVTMFFMNIQINDTPN